MPGAYAHSGAQIPVGVCANRCWASARPSRSANSRSRGVQQRLERMRQRTAQQFDRAGVDQAAQQRAGAVPPAGGEILERSLGFGEFANPEGAQRFRCAGRRRRRAVSGADAGGLGGAQLPVGQPVMHAVKAVRVVELRRHHRSDAQRDQPMPVLVGQSCAAPAAAAGRPPTTTGRAIPRRPASGRDGPATADGCAAPG